MIATKPIPAPRTREGKEVAKSSLEKVSSTGMKRVTKGLSIEEARSAPATELNLSALISEVERDIWFLEQLENNSSNANNLAKKTETELPFPITKEILALPGYKPKQNKAEKPKLPPKARRSSGLPIPETLHQRLLPKENCVTNILYSRRLPSPPVFRKKVTPPAILARDDHFVDTSIISNPYEEISDEVGARRDLFCPLCNCSFGYSFGLECHLLSSHQDILKLAKNEQKFLEDVMISRSEFCPCCQAQFLTPGLVVKHLVSHHQNFILKCVDPEVKPLTKNFQCSFCGQTFPKRHEKLLMLHIDQKHIGELEAKLMARNQLRGQDPGHLSNEVALMLTLSKTVNFNNTIGPNRASPPKLTNNNTTTKVFNKFGTLRSSLKKKKSDSISSQTFDKDHQLLTHEMSARFASETNPHYYDVVVDKRERSSPGESGSDPKRVRSVSVEVRPGRRTNFQPRCSQDTPFKFKKTSVPENTTGRRLVFGPPMGSYQHVPQPEPPPLARKKSSISEGEVESMTSSTGSSSVSSSSARDAANIFFSFSESMERWRARSLGLKVDEEDDNDTSLKMFKCNLCELSFADNVILLGHLKNRHRSTVAKALKPQFSCGVCPAKFFKNSFLVKHCESHEKTRS